MLDKKALLTAADLLRVTVSENKASLVGIRARLPFLRVEYEKEDMLAYTGDDILVREDLIPLIEQAYQELQDKLPGHNFLIRYGYRHPEVQQRYFDTRYDIHKAENPELDEVALIELTHTQVALPTVAGHPTGGAIDLTIINGEDKEFDMGTGIADYREPEKCFTYSDNITAEQAKNRAFLADIMLNAGFAPYNGEWWHFSYGDREWACFYDKPHTLYEQIEYRQD